jgi:hypothetical protein
MHLRKFLAVFLALCLVASLPLTAGAAQPERRRAAPAAVAYTELTPGTPAKVTVSKPGDPVWFAFTPQQTGLYTIRTDSDSRVYCFVEDAGNAVLYFSDGQENDGNVAMPVLLTAGEKYIFETGYDSASETGAYNLSVSQDGMPPVTPIEPDTDVRVTLKGGAVYYSFTPSHAGKYTLAADSGIDTICCLFDENWNRIGSADDTGEDRDFTLTADLQPGQTYYFEVRFYHNDSGSFTIRLSGDTIPFVAVDVPTQVRITAQNPAAYYCFVPEETGWYALTANSGGMDTICGLYDAQGNFLQESDMGGEGDDFSLAALLEAGKTYFYEVQYFGNAAEGTFEILLSWLGPQENIVLTVDVPAQADIYGGGQSRFCSFTPDRSGYYVLRAEAQGEDTILWLYDEEGNYISTNDDNPAGAEAALMHYLQAGVTYSYEVAYYYEALIGTVDLTLSYMGTATPSEKLENGMVVFYEVTDLVLGDDGIYRTPEGDTVYIAVDNKGDFGISLLDRFTLLDIVVEHGLMMDLTHWDALTASMDDDGYVVLTEKTLGYLVTLLTGNPDLGATEADAALMLFYDAEQIHRHAYMQAVTAPTCTQQGYTTYTCACGDSYVDDYVDALGHKYENGICAGCGQAEPEAPLGDVNSDGKIDAMDACCIVRYYRETLELTEKQLKTADVDGNGRVDLADACCIALFHSGKISVFPGQK